MADPIALPLPEAAAAVGLSERELRRAIAANELAPRYRGSKPLIDVEELRDWFRALPTERPERRTA